MPASMRLLLHIDDSPEDRAASRRVISSRLSGWKMIESDTGDGGLGLLQRQQPDCILLDYNLPDMSGLEVLEIMGDRLREVPVIIATGSGNEEVAVKALKSGARDYLVKDIRGVWLQLLPHVIERVVGKHMLELRELRIREARMRLLLESSGDGIYGVDTEGRCTFANRACVTMLGYDSADELLGRDVHALIQHHHSDGREYPLADCPIGNTWRGGDGVHAEGETFWRRDGTGFSVDYTSFPMRDETGILLGAVVSFRDISERLQQQEHLIRLSRTYATLSACNHNLVHALDEADLVQRFCQTLVDVGGFALAWIGLSDQQSQRTFCSITHAGLDADFDSRLCVSIDPSSDRGWLAALAMREGEIHIARVPDDCLCFEHCNLAGKGCGHRAVAALPLRHEGAVLGVMALYTDKTNVFDDQQIISLLQELADDLAFGLVMQRRNVSRAAAEAALHLRDQAIQAASNGIMIVDADQLGWPLIYANPAFERITGYSLAEVIGRNPAFLSDNSKDQLGLEMIRSALIREESVTTQLLNHRKDGTPFWNELHIAPVQDGSGRVRHYVGIINDISERVRYEKELEYQASYDELTGLPNRHLLMDRLNQAIVFANRNAHTCAVLFLDLDRFKLVNDDLGHNVGDELLKIIANRLANCGRQGDTVVRYGGDEFVVVLPDLIQPEDLYMVVERLRMAASEPVTLMGNELRLSASIGVARYPEDGENPETLLRCADIAMYRAKEAGGNCMRLFASEMATQLSERVQMERDLRCALERNEVIPHYQPQIEISSGRIIGMEALARWTHPRLGAVSPGKFIPLAEDTGLIVPLGEQILEQVCRQVMDWRKQGLEVPSVAVNLSPRQLIQPDLASRIAEILIRTGMDGSNLELEVTESALMHSPEHALQLLGKLKSLGIKLSLDDFGTGYSSLSYLKRFPFDLLKIDQSFVRDLPDDNHDAAITLTIINMARSLNLKVLAEGVENDEQHQFLMDHACEYAQGWLYGKPMPAGDLSIRLTANA